jgi:PhnB protein
MRLNPYLTFNGQCEAALKFYEQSLGAQLHFKMPYGESPAAQHVPPETHNLIIHSTLTIGDQQLMAADAVPGTYAEPKGVYVALHLNGFAEGKRIFDALSQGGKVEMDFQKTFWAAGFGQCVDRFGIPWMVNCEHE